MLRNSALTGAAQWLSRCRWSRRTNQTIFLKRLSGEPLEVTACPRRDVHALTPAVLLLLCDDAHSACLPTMLAVPPYQLRPFTAPRSIATVQSSNSCGLLQVEGSRAGAYEGTPAHSPPDQHAPLLPQAPRLHWGAALVCGSFRGPRPDCRGQEGLPQQRRASGRL